MRSTTKSHAERGFTLIEVMVALAIAAGALVLILSANTASLEKSVRARVSERLARAAESKFSEWKVGAERAAEGALPEYPDYHWEVRTAREESPALRRLVRIRFVVGDARGPVLDWTELRNTSEVGP